MAGRFPLPAQTSGRGTQTLAPPHSTSAHRRLRIANISRTIFPKLNAVQTHHHSVSVSYTHLTLPTILLV